VRGRPQAESAHRALPVAQALLAEILHRGLDAARELVARDVGADGLAGVGELGKPRGDRSGYYCSELVVEACVAAGLIDPAVARPAATYPADLFFERSLNPFLRRNFDLSPCWYPPARWTACPCGRPD